MTPYFCIFDQNFLVKTLYFAKFEEKKNKLLKLNRFCAVSHLMTPFFVLSPKDTLFASKLSLIVPWFDVSVGAHLSLFMWVPSPLGCGHPDDQLLQISQQICNCLFPTDHTKSFPCETKNKVVLIWFGTMPAVLKVYSLQTFISLYSYLTSS